MAATPGDPAEQRELPGSVSVEGPRHRVSHVALVATIVTFLMSMVAVGLFVAGKKWFGSRPEPPLSSLPFMS